MSYAWRLWFGFTLVMGVLLTAMGWMSLTAVRLDRADAAARQRAIVDENVRLALWRMDSALAPLLAQESAHPYYQGSGPSLSEPANRRDPFPAAGSRPLTNASDSFCVLLRFRHPIDGSLLSPSGSTVAAGTDATESRLARLAQRVSLKDLLVKLPASERDLPRPSISRGGGELAHSRAATEFQQRSQSLMMNNALVQQLQTQQPDAKPLTPIMLTPVWASGEMVLARRTTRARTESIEGCLVDWPTMQEWLLGLVSDLLPHARLEPLEGFDPAGETGLLAALPARLLPGTASFNVPEPRSAVPQMLALAWFAVLLAAIAGAVLVAGVVRLSQRRAAFVSAVTHELRTPLTTFRMYTEMLVQGMVRDPEAQREYLQTLRDQSLRLSHLVENVLAYARLERGRGLAPPEEIVLAELLAPMLPRLEQQASDGQFELVVEQTAVTDTLIRANPSAVEQILMNLVDNACKYASAANDRRIQLSARREGRYLALRVRDHGPGMPAQRKWFQPFGKSVQEAAHSAPGIGLGLGLSRRLAQQMGGRLDVDHQVNDGAALVLRLRLGTPVQYRDESSRQSR